jgi:hypothetical protein
VERSLVPVLEVEPWVTALREKLAAGAYPVTLFGENESESRIRVWSLLGDATDHVLWMTSTRMGKDHASVASLGHDFPAMNYFECELFEQTGIVPERHPWLRPVRTTDDWRKNGEPYEFYGVKGEEVHEVAVGPVHAGVIEPGHFRFQCYGEQILHLEIMLGYQRRGVETLLPQRNPAQQIVLVESIAGDSVIAHATAFCAGIESLAGSTLSLRDHAVRSIAAELERIAMHLSTLSGISIDIGFALPAAAIGNLRTLAINLTAEICGSRFGRGWIIPGGVRFDADEAWIEKAKKVLATIREKFSDAEVLLFNSASALSRLEDTGTARSLMSCSRTCLESSRELRSKTRRFTTGRACPSQYEKMASRIFHYATRASISPMPATICSNSKRKIKTFQKEVVPNLLDQIQAGLLARLLMALSTFYPHLQRARIRTTAWRSQSDPD